MHLNQFQNKCTTNATKPNKKHNTTLTILLGILKEEKNPNYLFYLKMVSAFVDMEDAVPSLSSSAASQKAKFSPRTNTHTYSLLHL